MNYQFTSESVSERHNGKIKFITSNFFFVLFSTWCLKYNHQL
jgi:hypothetical protein